MNLEQSYTLLEAKLLHTCLYNGNDYAGIVGTHHKKETFVERYLRQEANAVIRHEYRREWLIENDKKREREHQEFLNEQKKLALELWQERRRFEEAMLKARILEQKDREVTHLRRITTGQLRKRTRLDAFFYLILCRNGPVEQHISHQDTLQRAEFFGALKAKKIMDILEHKLSGCSDFRIKRI